MRIALPLARDAGPSALYERFEQAAGADPDRPLLEEASSGISLSGGQLSREAARLGTRLRQAGLREGELVLLTDLSGAGFLTALLAVWQCGGAALAAGGRVTPAEAERLEAAFHPAFAVVPAGAAGETTVRRLQRSGFLPLPSGTALVKLTSGSTGLPRGIAVTAAQEAADGAHILEGMGIEPSDLNIGAIPLTHSYGMGNLVMPLVLAGIPLRLVDPASPSRLAEALSGPEPAIFPGVPFLFGLLAREDGPEVTRRGLRLCLSAGAPLAPATAIAFRKRLGLPIRSFYGTSETGGIAFDASPRGDAAERHDGGVGSPLPGVTVTMRGEEGRVVVAGASVATGYLGADAGEAEGAGRFETGCFVTGDLARRLGDAEGGGLLLTGRVAGLLNVAGRKVNPREIEQALLEIGGVREAMVLGEPDAARGEAPVACVAADGGLDAGLVLSRLRERLSDFKLPRRILFLPELPRGERGKVDVAALRERLASGGRT